MGGSAFLLYPPLLQALDFEVTREKKSIDFYFIMVP